jgi:hypothetical protein
MDNIGKDALFETKEEAIKTIYNKLDKNICSTCKNLIFNECNTDV